MGSLEQRIRPGAVEVPWPRDVMGAGLIIALTAVLLAGWRVDQQRHFADVVGQMYSFSLLGSLAFALALRAGAVDLSIWATSALGGAAAVAAARTGAGPGVALAAAALAGAAIGALHGLLVARLRVPSFIVTLVSAVIVAWSLESALDGRQIVAPADTFAPWLTWIPAGSQHRLWLPWTGQPPFVLRMLLVAGSHLAVLTVLAAVELLAARAAKRRSSRPNAAVGIFAALCGSGLLAGLAGGVWLAEHGWSPVPTRAIGDLRIPAAAVLAGAAFFAGRRRAMLVVLALPAATLAAMIWRVEVAHLSAGGYHLQMVLLIGMTIVTHLAMLGLIDWRRSPLLPAAAAVALTAGGMVTLAAAAGTEPFWARRLCHIVGIGAWTAGAITLIVCRVVARRRGHRPASPARTQS